MSPEQGPGTYQVLMSGAIQQSLRDLHREAVARGAQANFMAAARIIARHLETNPRDFGEIVYHLRGLRLEMRTAVVPPLSVSFGVHEEQPFVVISKLKLV